MEKRNVMFVVGYFTVGLLGGWLIAKSKEQPQPQHVNVEYYIELKPNDSVVIEDRHGNTYTCPTNSIPEVLIKDNL